MSTCKISTMITDIKHFDPHTFTENDIGIEIQTFPQHILDGDYGAIIHAFKKQLIDYKGIISVHGPAFDLNPGSTDGRIIEVTKYRYLQAIDIAKQLRATYLVFHSQINPLLKIKRIRQMKLNNQITFWKNLLEELRDDTITFLLENEYDDDYNDLLFLVENIQSDKVKICLDIGHALAYSDLHLSEWIGALKDHIKYIHLHWNNREIDAHNQPTDAQLSLLSDLLVENDISPIIMLEYSAENIIEEAIRVRKLFDK